MHLDLMRDPAKKFPVTDRKLEITTLRIWHCKYTTLESLAEFQNLEELVIASFPDHSLNVLKSLPKLRYLSILHLPKVSSIEDLAELESIECLSLATSPGWDAARKFALIESLKPIAKLSSLRHLELFGVCTADKSLAEIEHCKGLASARFSQYPLAEVERFYQATGVVDSYNPAPSFLKE
ncbi:leucine-rich repeat domain-containing protein [Undibacterium sp. Ji42W]|uniref:leucine-rich repeat domain-containing protein n=1 Tax=Undibacterium sp. Ji42W TaxID=3413039 RepID=UPI003BF1E01F